LYADQKDTDFSEVLSFNKFVGGSPANIATAIAKLGAKPGFIGCVSADGLGTYVVDYLTSVGVDVEGMQRDDSGTRTSLAVTEMRSNQPEVVLYRNNAADLCLKPDQISLDYIKRSKMLLISGTALSASPSRESALIAMQMAKSVGTLVVLDIDYRAYSWTDLKTAALYYRLAAQLSDIVIGNREEFSVLETLPKKGSISASTREFSEEQFDDHCASRCIEDGASLVIVKAGEEGSKVYPKQGNAFRGKVFSVTAKKPFGAGDAFAGTLLFGLIENYSLADSVAMGAASAAINVASESCTEALPTLRQLLACMESYSVTK
jgi:5-dehydro-2-deoxygluconokinase